ncbi:MAG: hypothetical protein D6805_07830 [Planctomycetota bacterium]|nr:MAG: hypothetical protein D6805_07830 [Planctomycetota bacterium]
MTGQKGVNLLYPLIIAVVVAGAALFMAVQFNSDIARYKEDAEQARIALKKEKEDKKSYIQEKQRLTEFITGSRSVETVDIAKLRESTIKVANEEAADLVYYTRKGDRQWSTLTEIYPDLFAEIKELQKKLAKLRSQLKAEKLNHQADVKALEEKLKSAKEELATVTDEKNAEIRSITEKLQEAESERERYRNDYEAAVRAKEVEVGNYKTIIIPHLENRILDLEQVIQRLKETIRQRKTIQDLEPDGEIIVTDQSLGYAWVNLGRVHGLRKGLIFKVFQNIKGGRRNFKGKIEIISVEEKMAQARIIEQIYRNDPIIKGDYIISPIFDKNQKKYFVFAGQRPSNRLYDTATYKRLLEERNQVVENEVSNRTDFVVLLDKFKLSEEYKEAKNFPWIIFLREQDLLEYLGK